MRQDARDLRARTTAPAWPIKSDSPQHLWPAVPTAFDGEALAIFRQIEASQWWPHRRLQVHQLAQAESLIHHACRTVPFYRRRLNPPTGRLTMAGLRSLPIIRREDLQAAGSLRYSRALPQHHEPVAEVQTSGSTGRPLHALDTRVTRSIYRAMNLRVARWHQLDVAACMASIRPSMRTPQADSVARWLPVVETGDAAQCEPTLPIEEQLDWLNRTSPQYLQGYPSVIAAIAKAAEKSKAPALERIFTFGETLEPWVRTLCRDVLGAEIVDCYSTIECGMIALQCPLSGKYHGMAESALVEILDDSGRPCRPGCMGRVVITVLHNFATPFIRYDTGDYAQVGHACPCGRGLPTLERITGRARNLLTLPDGRRRWPFPHSMEFAGQAPVRQFQIVQTSLDTLEVRLSLTRPFTDTEQASFGARLLAAIGHPFELTYKLLADIPRSSGGKFEDFIGLAEPANPPAG